MSVFSCYSFVIFWNGLVMRTFAVRKSTVTA